MKIREFMQRNYKHFNAAVCVDASEGWIKLLEEGGKMMVTLAGAMSTAELGISLAEMIRNDKVHAISCTGANLEEDIFNLVAHNHYERVPHYRSLTKEDEMALLKKGMNRVTDTCIPEDHAIRAMEHEMLELWQEADREGKSYFPYEFMYKLLKSGKLEGKYQIDPKDSWLLAAMEKNLPIITPGWEDSTLANIFVSHVISKDLSRYSIVKSGTEQMGLMIDWYKKTAPGHPIGFFQIGGGIAGDFPICVVPLIRQDLQEDYPLWSYFCQISDSTTSFGSYSGAVPNEKITWGKISIETPSYIIESDASIVAPLVFNYVLDR
ncbi:deoxyhypusine synthase family protein [Criblamydia sequanensis]|uniref:Deoxyhypusine synthase-like protein n=1 Tax=Candidatus Criblamydia sequanensis CRIB-18 TaxID=1437425 RepID=A0A090CYA3_9BACT|nr:deoxyhypusine synthase family protein [Criblamydia sequanensis]CDR33457.1 Deoxyhypusine synthase-like protein [Criblamydia sequanensis CRIB-18]